MAWTNGTTASEGQYIMLQMSNGYLIGELDQAAMLERLNQKAQGWRVVKVVYDRGAFGVGAALVIYGQAEQTVSLDIVASQAADALNSFWLAGGFQFTVQVSNVLTEPPTPLSQAANTLQMVALAVVVVGIVWGVTQLRKAFQ